MYFIVIFVILTFVQVVEPKNITYEQSYTGFEAYELLDDMYMSSVICCIHVDVSGLEMSKR